MKLYTQVHIGDEDEVTAGSTRRIETGLLTTTVTVGDVLLVAPPRVMRHVAEQLLAAADAACAAENALTDETVPAA